LLGKAVGSEGEVVGLLVFSCFVGCRLGAIVGLVGDLVGRRLGRIVGFDGDLVGLCVGNCVGRIGERVGLNVRVTFLFDASWAKPIATSDTSARNTTFIKTVLRIIILLALPPAE